MGFSIQMYKVLLNTALSAIKKATGDINPLLIDIKPMLIDINRGANWY